MNQSLRLRDLAWPIFVENFLAKAIGMVNIYLLSRYNNEAVAAIGISNQLLFIINILFIFVTLGTAVVVSQNIGAGKYAHAVSASSIAIILNLVIGITVGVIVFLFHRTFLTMMGLTGQVLEYASIYFRILGGLCFLQGLNFSLGTIMRNYGQARTPMMVFLGMNVLNLIGNTIIILRPFGLPDFGIGGVASWTIFSHFVGAVVMVMSALRYKISFRLEKPFPFAGIREILRIGVPGAGDIFAFSIMLLFLTSFVASLGTTAMTSYTYAMNLIALVQLLGYSVGQSSQILVGRLIGAKNFDEAYKLGFRSLRIAMILNLSCMAALMIFQRPILHVLGANEEIMSILFWCFLIDLGIEIGRPFNLVIGNCVRGAGDVKWTIIVSTSSILFVCIPLGYLFTHVFSFGVAGAFMALLIDEWLRGQLITWRWRSRKWEKAAVVH
jgi:putative MATE family efflux protein